MSIKHRLAKLEQRADKEIPIEQVIAKIREFMETVFETDLSQCSEEELFEYVDEFMRQDILRETGRLCQDWTHDRLLSEYGNLLRGITT